MQRLILAIICCLFTTNVWGDQAKRGFTVRDGQLVLIGEFKQLSAIEVRSKNGKLSVGMQEIAAGVKLKSKEPFGQQAVIITDSPEVNVIGVLGANNQLRVKGTTKTAIRYAGKNAQQDLVVKVGAEGLNAPQEVSWLTGDKVATEIPDYVAKALDRMVGKWTASSNVEGKQVNLRLSMEWAIKGKTLSYQWTSGVDEVSAGSGIIGWNAKRNAVVEHEMGGDGSESFALHKISKDGDWESPMHGTWVVDKRVVQYHLERKFEFQNDNEWSVKFSEIRVEGKLQPDRVRKYRRQQVIED